MRVCVNVKNVSGYNNRFFHAVAKDLRVYTTIYVREAASGNSLSQL